MCLGENYKKIIIKKGQNRREKNEILMETFDSLHESKLLILINKIQVKKERKEKKMLFI